MKRALKREHKNQKTKPTLKKKEKDSINLKRMFGMVRNHFRRNHNLQKNYSVKRNRA